jgi:hypothetical protein
MKSPQSNSTSRRADNAPCAALAMLVAVLPLALAGCSAQFDPTYGRTSESYINTSVNGTDVLAAMLTEAGFEVSARAILMTSSMQRVETIVWFPNDIHAPSEEVCLWFDEWLAGGENRTLVYVGRGFDAEPLYFRKMAPGVSKDQQRFYRQQVSSQGTVRPRLIPDSKMQCEWFSIDWPEPEGPVTSLAGPWSQGIDVAKAEVYLSDKFNTHLSTRVLLSTSGKPLVTQIRDPAWGGGRIIAISNGSFLLNMTLVNHENRKLAGKLVDALRPSGPLVMLQSGPGGPPIDPPAGGSALARLFGAWPLNIILLHCAVLGIIFCFARWPIFGRPKTPPAEILSDFGKHVQAVGQLMQRTRDRSYAMAQLPADPERAKAEAVSSGGSSSISTNSSQPTTGHS